jgi:hypothetical protein
MQNLAPSGVSASQCGQRIDRLSCTVVRAVGGAFGQETRYLSLIRAHGMLCQYSRPAQVSSGNRNRALDPGAAEGGEDASDIGIDTVIVGRSRALSESLTGITRRADAAHAWNRGHAGNGLQRTRASIICIRPPRGGTGMPPRLGMRANLSKMSPA